MGKRVERKILSYEEQGGIVTVKYVERTYTDADAWLREGDEEEPRTVVWCNEVALKEFPNSVEFPRHSYRWTILDLLFRDGPLFEHQIRAALEDMPTYIFNRELDALFENDIVYRDRSGIHIDAQWLENYIEDFLAMPGADDDENI